MKKTILLGLVAATALVATSVQAADLPRRKVQPKAPEVIYSQYNWSGFYAGAQVGYAAGDTKFRYVTAPASANHSTSGYLAGVHAGYNHQYSNNIVVGAEADINYADINGNTACPNPAFRCSSGIEWYGTVRARAGYAFDRVLPYITGGFAYGDVRKATRFGAAGRSTTKTSMGWTAGAGVEYAITDRISARVEYSYLNFSSGRHAVDGPNVVKGRVDAHVVKLGISYKF
jgi:outer membrane immunogenic protein